MSKLIRRKTTIVRGRSAKSWNNWFGRLSPSQQQFLKTYFFHLVFLLFLANYVMVRQLQLTFFAQSCMSREMVAADNRCLYIYGGEVYEKGTKSKPHKGQKCGTDVTSIIPSFHTRDMAKYMDPNLVGTICSGQPTNTPVPQATTTRVPTQPPAVPTATQAPTATIRPNSPTNSPLPTSTRSPMPTATPRVITQSNPTSTPRIIMQVNPTATRIPTQKPQAITTLTPTVNREQITNNRSGFARYLADSEVRNQVAPAPEEKIAINYSGVQTTNFKPLTSSYLTRLVQLSQVAVGASFTLMVITTLAVGIKKLNQKFTRRK